MDSSSYGRMDATMAKPATTWSVLLVRQPYRVSFPTWTQREWFRQSTTYRLPRRFMGQ